ncbi:unnamed protein product [Microthlaspi erraticum]|uniref:F-box domain-containing protein n=1 Tax=Microthlaspi erraticum TaxID=1685480 RepID=A0A6D2KIA4_9BRAS|nr:unnamed protein product [Microthlaspi erraticum]
MASSILKGLDRISEIPDPLICQILSHLSTKEAVSTSVLSTRWRSLWLWVTSLDLCSERVLDFNAFMSFGYRFFDSIRVSCIHKAKLNIGENKLYGDDYLTWWIDALVKRKIQHLDVRYDSEREYCEMPLSLYTCKTLVYLKLFQVSFRDAELSKLSIAGSVSLPCLRTMHLESIFYPTEATFEGLVSSCPVLEELTVVGCETAGATVFRVSSRSLNKLVINLQFRRYNVVGSQVVIDAPLLGFLSIEDDLSDSFIVKNMHPNAKLDIWLAFGLLEFEEANVLSKASMIREFLPGVSGIKEMIIWCDTFKAISLYSKLEPVPRFRNLSLLVANLYSTDMKWLPTFLEICPVLKSLILEWFGDYEEMCSDYMNQISFSSVPECLSSSLEFVDIKSSVSGHVAEIKLIRYLLESSAILKKLTLRLNCCAKQNVIFKSLLKIPRRSVTCEVVVLRLKD